MKVFLLCLTVYLCVSAVRSQFLTDANSQREVLRTLVRPKSTRCAGYDYFIVTRDVGGVATEFVDRAFFYRVDERGIRTQLQCPTGTVYSVLPNECNCAVHVDDGRQSQLFTSRCTTVNVNMQSDSASYITNRINNAGQTIPIQSTIENYADAFLSSIGNCYYSNIDLPMAIPHFSANNVARNSFDITVGFSMAQNPTDAPYRLLSNGPCSLDNTAASFDLAYVRSGGSSTIALTLNVISSRVARGAGTEYSATWNCQLNSIIRPSQPTIAFNEGDQSNFVRVIGSLDNLNGIQIRVGSNTLPPGSFGLNNIPVGGFCSQVTVDNAPRSRGGDFVIAERACPLLVGVAPNTGFGNPAAGICIFAVSSITDC